MNERLIIPLLVLDVLACAPAFAESKDMLIEINRRNKARGMYGK
jgi:hypothetical protein